MEPIGVLGLGGVPAVNMVPRSLCRSVSERSWRWFRLLLPSEVGSSKGMAAGPGSLTETGVVVTSVTSSRGADTGRAGGRGLLILAGLF